MIITVAHQKGGTGKSTIATNLASLLKADMLDLDKQHSGALWNEQRYSVHEKNSKVVPVRMMVLESSGSKPAHAYTLPDAELLNFLSSYKNDKKVKLVIDTAGFDGQNNRLALVMADIVITPVALSGVEIFGLQEFEKILIEAKKQTGRDIPCYVLVNRVVKSSKIRLEDGLAFIKGKDAFNLLKSRLGQRIAFQRAYENGKNVIELNKTSLAAKEMAAVVKEIKQIIKKEIK